MAYHHDIDILARTVFGEARGEALQGQIAVAHVALTRTASPGWWTRGADDTEDDTIAAACLAPAQFSCWNPDDPNRGKIEAASLDDGARFQRAYAVALGCILELPGFDDPTGGADHYHADSVSPAWASGATPVCAIGHHTFYKLGKS